MIVVGIDPHKKTHTAVALDDAGREMDTITVAARTAGHERLLLWARALGSELTFALEDGRHVTGHLERFLIGRGEPVLRVPPKLMAGARRSARAFGKSDPIDASAVARAALREPNLPQARLAGPERDVGLLVAHREDLVAERTRIQNRLRWVLHDLDPALEVPPRALKRYRWLTRVRDWLRLREPTVQVRLATRLVARCEELSAEVNDLEAEISELVRLLVPELLALPGCGALTAAKIVAETAGASRFRTDAQFAMHAGVAPLEASSGGRSRHRLNRMGNRQLNAALHRLAVNQGRLHEPARIYLCRRQSEGLSRREALRCLKRHLARIVFNMLRDKEAMTVSPQSMIATIGEATA